jgi:hypothetical protein
LVNLSEIPRMIIYREGPFSSTEYRDDVLSLWSEAARRSSSVDGGQDALASGVIMAKHAMERSEAPEEVNSLFRQFYQSDWYQTIWRASLRRGDITANAATKFFEEEARRLPPSFRYRKQGASSAVIHYTDPEEGRKALLKVEFGRISPSASFGFVHPDRDWYFPLQSLFGLPGQWSYHFSSPERDRPQLRNMLSFFTVLLPVFARTRMDLTLAD